MEGELVEHIGVAPALQQRVLGRRQRMAQALGQFLGRGRGAQRIQLAHGGVGQRVDARAARRVALGQSPGQEPAQGRAFQFDGEGAVLSRQRGGPVHIRRRGAGDQAEGRLERGVQAVVRRARPFLRGGGHAGLALKGGARFGAATEPAAALFLPGTGRRQVQRVTMGERHDGQAAWRAADASSWPRKAPVA